MKREVFHRTRLLVVVNSTLCASLTINLAIPRFRNVNTSQKINWSSSMGLPDKTQNSVGGKPSHDKSPSYASLFHNTREPVILLSQNPNRRQVWRRADNPHALLFDIFRLKITDAEFRLAVGHSKLKGAHGIVVHRTRSYAIAEVAFETQELADKNLDQPVILADGTKVFGSHPIPEEWDVVKINLTHIPLYSRTTLSSSLSTALKPFGQLLELGIYLEQTFFTGKGYAYINITPKDANNSNKVLHVPPQQLVHSITVSRKDGSYPSRMFATWSKMPLYCRYCHLSGHTRLQCKQKPQPRCHFCQELGHIRKDCQIRQGKKIAPETANSNHDNPTSTFTFRINSKRQRNLPSSKSPPLNFTPTPAIHNNSPPAKVLPRMITHSNSPFRMMTNGLMLLFPKVTRMRWRPSHHHLCGSFCLFLVLGTFIFKNCIKCHPLTLV